MERAGLWPPNDPDFKNCLRNGNGVRLQWQSMKRAKPIYLMVMQRHDGGGWETRVEKTRVSGVAFALALRSAQARNSEFQWVLFQSQSNIPHESNYFCTPRMKAGQGSGGQWQREILDGLVRIAAARQG